MRVRFVTGRTGRCASGLYGRGGARVRFVREGRGARPVCTGGEGRASGLYGRGGRASGLYGRGWGDGERASTSRGPGLPSAGVALLSGAAPRFSASRRCAEPSGSGALFSEDLCSLCAGHRLTRKDAWTTHLHPGPELAHKLEKAPLNSVRPRAAALRPAPCALRSPRV